MNSKKSLRNEEIFKISLCSLLVAIILIMTFVDPLGYITINAVPITIIHIPVIIGSIILGRKYGLILGFVFGIGSMIRTFMNPNFIIIPFTNPILSVLPRMFIGFIAYDIYSFFTKVIKNDKLSIPFAVTLITLIHSLIVIPLFYLIGTSGFYFFANEYVFATSEKFMGFLVMLFTANSIIEIAFAILIGTPIIYALNTFIKHQI